MQRGIFTFFGVLPHVLFSVLRISLGFAIPVRFISNSLIIVYFKRFNTDGGNQQRWARCSRGMEFFFVFFLGIKCLPGLAARWDLARKLEGNVASGPSSGPQPEDIELKTQVEAMWEQMNGGTSNKTLKELLNGPSSTVNKTSSQMSNNWIAYLGLAPKGAPQGGSSVVQNGTGDDDKKIAALWEEMNKGVPKRTFKTKPSSTVNSTSQKKANNLKQYLAFAPKKTESIEQDMLDGILPQKRSSAMQDDINDDAKRIAAAALSAVRDAAAAGAGRGKVGITEVREFAGQEIEFKKLVDVDSKEASEKTKGPATSAVDAVLEQIKKKSKLSVLDKTKKDWGEFKEEKGLEEELDAYKKSSNQYLDKVSFLQRADYREFERERDARLLRYGSLQVKKSKLRSFVDADSKEASEKVKGPATSAVDAVLEQIKKKPKSALDKTKKDWGEADYREERDARLALHARRRTDNAREAMIIGYSSLDWKLQSGRSTKLLNGTKPCFPVGGLFILVLGM
ncbi:hypothetical protein Pint_24271 [Pistacia integerrima]|uniref:Uncharacterized protein n=1 Tax=Pistacia integerrima TaxID=434235 RepID=A0ACC0YFW1_9ROSI|nr:hypothetical protein Pint_24271 [Pistacia integerrima]